MLPPLANEIANNSVINNDIAQEISQHDKDFTDDASFRKPIFESEPPIIGHANSDMSQDFSQLYCDTICCDHCLGAEVEIKLQGKSKDIDNQKSMDTEYCDDNLGAEVEIPFQAKAEDLENKKPKDTISSDNSLDAEDIDNGYIKNSSPEDTISCDGDDILDAEDTDVDDSDIEYYEDIICRGNCPGAKVASTLRTLQDKAEDIEYKIQEDLQLKKCLFQKMEHLEKSIDELQKYRLELEKDYIFVHPDASKQSIIFARMICSNRNYFTAEEFAIAEQLFSCDDGKCYNYMRDTLKFNLQQSSKQLNRVMNLTSSSII